MPRRETAREGDLVERGGIGAAAQERIAKATLPLARQIHQHGGKWETGGILGAAHILAEQRRNAGVGDAESGLVVVDEDVVGMALVPDRSGGGEEPLLRFLLRDLARGGGALKAVRHLPHGVDNGARLLGTFCDKLAAGDQ
jgi:hypothetical protein